MNDGQNNEVSLFALVQMEVELQIGSIQSVMPLFGAPEEEAIARDQLIRCFRSLRSAAKMVAIDSLAQLAANIETGLAQSMDAPDNWSTFQIPQLERCLTPFRGLLTIQETELSDWLSQQQPEIDALIQDMKPWFVEGNSNQATATTKVASAQAQSTAAPAQEAHIDNTPFSTQYADEDMMGLFRVEVENNGQLLGQQLLELEQNTRNVLALEPLMRSAHSIKGAARMVNVESAVQIAHAMESLFVAAQEGKLHLDRDHIDLFFEATDLIKEVSKIAQKDLAHWHGKKTPKIRSLIAKLGKISSGHSPEKPSSVPSQVIDSQVEQFLQSTAPIKTFHVPTSFELDADEVMLELFRAESSTQTALLREKLIEIEQDPKNESILEELMRSANSLKSAAGMIKSSPVISITGLMEECFVAAQEERISIDSAARSTLFTAVDLIAKASQVTPKQAPKWLSSHKDELTKLLSGLQSILTPPIKVGKAESTPELSSAPKPTGQIATEEQSKRLKADTSIRVSTQSLNRLLGLAGESLVESRWVRPYTETLQSLKRRHVDLISTIDHLRELLMTERANEKIMALARQIEGKASHCREEISDRISDMEDYERRATNLAGRLNQEVIASRMRPFADGVHGFRRMVRDLAKSLDKEVLLDIRGLNTKVDRDILEKIEAPLNHILRNAIDHGIELPDERERAGKPRQATIRLEAAHVSGMLSVVVEDDGKGIDIEVVKKKIVARKLATAEMVACMSKPEILEFLFLPSFSTKEDVTELSGRGVGLDVVLTVMQEMRGSVRAISNFGTGTKFHLQLPLTLSVVRALMVQIGGEPYAFPLARVERTMKLNESNIEVLEGREYFTFGNQHISIMDANQIMGLSQAPPDTEVLSIVIIGERANRYGLVVDRFLGEKDLVVHPLDERLGKVKDISASSIMDDGSPTLILDVEDILRSIDLLITGSRLSKHQPAVEFERTRKRILVVDDSITVREVEKNMLEARGYEVALAVDGVDGWNAVRADHYDLVISDIDMPRMNGFDFVSLIRRDHNLKGIPVMIVSYKDREEDKIRGMEVGADAYVPKGSFQDETLLKGVIDLIGEA